MRLREPLLIPALGLAVGIALDSFLHFDSRPLGLAAVAFGCLLALAAFRNNWPLALTCGSLALAALGASRHAEIRQRPVPMIEAESREMLVLSGCVVDPPALHAPRDRTRFLLEFEPGAIAQVSLYPRNDEVPPVIREGEWP